MEVLNSRQHVTCVTPPTDGGAYPTLGPWAIRRALGSFSSDLAQPDWLGFLLAQSRCFQSKARIYAAMRIVNGLRVWEGRMSEWGEWWADLKVMIWWMAISVVSGELLALARRETGFF
jgi:hypothetical protein